MLLEFSVLNYSSFRERAVLSLLPAALKGKSPEVDHRAQFLMADGRKVLKSAVLYGPNASGKSNLLGALACMRSLVVNSAREGQAGDGLGVEPFRLSTTTLDQPSEFEIVFVEEGVQYRYGFAATRTQVLREWLFHRPKVRESQLFEREGQKFELTEVFKEGADLVKADKIRPDALLLSAASAWNGAISKKIVEGWFRGRLRVVMGVNDHPAVQDGMRTTTAKMLLEGKKGGDLEKVRLRLAIEDLLRAADLGIDGLSVRTQAAEDSLPEAMPPELRAVFLKFGASEVHGVRTQHRVFDGDGKVVSTTEFSLDREESDGTRKLFALAGPVVDALAQGRVMVVDELDARMHPLLSRAIVDLFQDPERNPKGAQLIVATHDVNLLDPELFRRDQVWFVEKDRKEGSTLISLAEYRGVRNNAPYRDAYLEGRYRAVPSLRRFGLVLANKSLPEVKDGAT